ncbi:lysoplasmalogenase [Terracoccus sp. 273MFTsu3.1]|uniref:lysoplasmalogenase n=1 Tax=Terracoccus sp. 273MFTsu3.1 TaxID=1172188 RepID=UPI0012DDBED9|nr:lysoplasmalogenase [Terracoccus sp. 273MFTsu3.1]
MTTHLWVTSVALGVTALINWGSVLRGDHLVERITKPLVVLLLMGLAWSLYWEGRVPGSPPLLTVIVALAFCLVGDVALLHATETRFLVGLGAFLVAHLAYVWAILETVRAEGFPWPLLVAVPFLAVLHAKAGRDIVRHSGPQKGPVFVYQLVLFVLVLVAAGTGDWLLLLGCLVFVVSDTVLGHDRFVHERRWAPLTVIVTYHVAQTLIVVALYR